MSYPLEFSLTAGHDVFGRTLYSLLPHAALRSGAIATAVALLTPVIAATLPMFLSLMPRRARAIALWLQDLLLPLPSIMISLTLAAITRPGYGILLLALGLGALPAQMRYTLARTQEILEQEFALQSRALGATPWRVLRTHLLPALPGWMRAQFPHLFGAALIGEAILSFLGVGAPIGEDTLGTLLLQGKEYAWEAPWILAGTSVTLLALLGLMGLVRRVANYFFTPHPTPSAKL